MYKDGQATPTANIPMGSFKLTGLAAGTAAGNSLRYEQGLQSILTTIGDTIQTTAANTAARLAATATVAAHATTMDPWNARVVTLSGGAVTFTDIADADYVGQEVLLIMNAAHIWTDGAVFDVQGGATYTTAAGDQVLLVATAVDAFDVTIFPATGMPVAGTRFKVGSFTRDTATASGTQAITGVGFTPKAVIFLSVINSTSASSIGVDDGTTDGSVNTLAAAWTFGTSGAAIDVIVSGTNQYQGSISSFDADGFTITWTKLNSPTGTITSAYLALR